MSALGTEPGGVTLPNFSIKSPAKLPFTANQFFLHSEYALFRYQFTRFFHGSDRGLGHDLDVAYCYAMGLSPHALSEPLFPTYFPLTLPAKVFRAVYQPKKTMPIVSRTPQAAIRFICFLKPVKPLDTAMLLN